MPAGLGVHIAIFVALSSTVLSVELEFVVFDANGVEDPNGPFYVDSIPRLNDSYTLLQWYRYNNPNPESFNNLRPHSCPDGAMRDRLSIIGLTHEGAPGAPPVGTSLAMILDVANDATGGTLEVEVTCDSWRRRQLPTDMSNPFLWAGVDDESECGYRSDEGQIDCSFAWDACCTDGLLFGPLGDQHVSECAGETGDNDGKAQDFFFDVSAEGAALSITHIEFLAERDRRNIELEIFYYDGSYMDGGSTTRVYEGEFDDIEEGDIVSVALDTPIPVPAFATRGIFLDIDREGADQVFQFTESNDDEGDVHFSNGAINIHVGRAVDGDDTEKDVMFNGYICYDTVSGPAADSDAHMVEFQILSDPDGLGEPIAFYSASSDGSVEASQQSVAECGSTMLLQEGGGGGTFIESSTIARAGVRVQVRECTAGRGSPPCTGGPSGGTGTDVQPTDPGTEPGGGGTQPTDAPTTDGGTQPTEPGDGGTQPTDAPTTDGGTQPTDAPTSNGGTQPTDAPTSNGGTQPTEPGGGGTQPTTNPGDGGTQPTTNPGDGGGTQPTEPGDGGTQPTEPGGGGTQPTEPGGGGTQPTEPGDGGTQPTEPGGGGTQPTEPGDGGGTQPTEPGDGGGTQPTEPGGGGGTQPTQPTEPGGGGGGGGEATPTDPNGGGGGTQPTDATEPGGTPVTSTDPMNTETSNSVTEPPETSGGGEVTDTNIESSVSEPGITETDGGSSTDVPITGGPGTQPPSTGNGPTATPAPSPEEGEAGVLPGPDPGVEADSDGGLLPAAGASGGLPWWAVLLIVLLLLCCLGAACFVFCCRRSRRDRWQHSKFHVGSFNALKIKRTKTFFIGGAAAEISEISGSNSSTSAVTKPKPNSTPNSIPMSKPKPKLSASRTADSAAGSVVGAAGSVSGSGSARISSSASSLALPDTLKTSDTLDDLDEYFKNMDDNDSICSIGTASSGPGKGGPPLAAPLRYDRRFPKAEDNPHLYEDSDSEASHSEFERPIMAADLGDTPSSLSARSTKPLLTGDSSALV